MKILDIIKSNNIIKDDNDITILEAKLIKHTNELFISILLDHTISFDDYNALNKCVLDIVNKLKLKLYLSVGYKDDTLDNESAMVYLKNILDKLKDKSAKYNIFNIDDFFVNDNKFSLMVAKDELGYAELLNDIKLAFANYGIGVELTTIIDETKSIAKQIDAIDQDIQKSLERQQAEAREANQFNEATKAEKKQYYRKMLPTSKTDIKDIPSTINALSIYQHEQGMATFLINAYVFSVEVKKFTKTKSALAVLKVTDETDSIVVKKWLRLESEIERYQTEIKNGTELRIIGTAEYDNFIKDVVLMASDIEYLGTHKEDIPEDTSPVKRVELNAHTKMTTLDGLAEPKDYLKMITKWGWKTMAFTDLSGVYSIPDIDHELAHYPNFKPIYGVELPFIHDDEYFITFKNNQIDASDIDLKEATYVVYDIETTGFSQEFDEIIEIAAYKVYKGGIIDSYEVFVNPKRHVREKITRLTTITDEILADAKTIDEVLPEFLEFAKGSILVAHNAKFDVGMIYAKAKKLGLDYEILPAIDTLNLFRAGYYDQGLKAFNLKVLCKFFKVKQEQHHRASDDTRVLALCFISMLNDLYNKGIYNFKDINSLINKDVHWKYVIPRNVNFLCLNKTGFKNMYKLLSDSLTKHLYLEARCLKSEFDKYKEGIIVGSGSDSGYVFEYALNRSEEELAKEISFYDYIEVCPPSGYAHLYEELPNGIEDIKKVINKIIRVAKAQNKLVCAVSNVHYLRPSDKKYRDILIASPQIGGGLHRLWNKDLINPLDAVYPNCHLRTTDEMLSEFDFLDKDLAYEIVVTNTNKIADMVEKYPAFRSEMFAPADDEFKEVWGVESIPEEVKRIVEENALRLYGEHPHPIIRARIDRELHSIISNGYASVYYMSHRMVKDSLDHGYLVGSRGSVGSSLVATLMNITEVNPLAPHYRCKNPNCKFHAIRMTEDEIAKYGISKEEEMLMPNLLAVDSGYDLEAAKCPKCGSELAVDGHDIPFETFLGFDGDKVPDIDLNFSGEYQAQAHKFIQDTFGVEYAFRGGTVGTIADKNAYGYVKGYCERMGLSYRSCEMDRLASHLVGIKRSTGQHPGGIVVVPHRIDIFDVTPVQYPADDNTAPIRTTHYDYHSFENNLLKLDVLGHDDPTIIKYIMDYVHAHQSEFPFESPQDIPIYDKNLYRLFNETEVIGLKPEALNSPVASFAVPEFGTNFVRNMLVDTKPKTFAQLVKISGLSHGTNVWATNAQVLVSDESPFGKIPFKDIIGCRDDIMVDLINKYHLEPLKAFKIMEFVRKGKLHKNNKDDIAKWNDSFKKDLEACNVDEWYIWSCERIEYMFPKAHAIAYVMMALRIAWFKVYSPALFYSAWFSKRAKAYNVKAFLGGPIAIKAEIERLSNLTDSTAKDEDMITSLQVALEATLRGIKFLNVDIFKSSATIFEVEDGNLRMPFTAVDKLGESVAITVVEARKEKPFTSIKDVSKRTKLNASLIQEFKDMNSFGTGDNKLPDEDKYETDGIFGLF